MILTSLGAVIPIAAPTYFEYLFPDIMWHVKSVRSNRLTQTPHSTTSSRRPDVYYLAFLCLSFVFYKMRLGRALS